MVIFVVIDEFMLKSILKAKNLKLLVILNIVLK